MSGQTRYFISAICNFLFVMLFHLHTAQHLSRAIYIRENATAIRWAFEVSSNPAAYMRPDGEETLYNAGVRVDDGYLDAD